MENLKDKVRAGAIWSLVERFGYLGIQFISNLVLARLLTPFDFGTIGILLIFTTISAVFVDSGFGASLIQKKNITEKDIATVFYTNIVISLIIYTTLYFSSSRIGFFFKNPDIPLLLRYIGIIIIIDAFGTIQNTLLNKYMKFKEIAKLKICAAFFACSLSIIAALYGLGVWALVLQYLLYSTLRTIFLYFYSKWRPSFNYSFNSLKELGGYGSKLLGASLISEIYINFQSILIGRFINSTTLGFYTQAKQLQQVPVTSLASVINQVSFPAFSSIQDDKVKFRNALSQNINILSMINFPLMCVLSAVATPLFIFLYSDKWINSVPYFQFLCMGFGLLLPIHNANLAALKALGKSNYVLKLEILKKISGVILLVIGTIKFGIWGLLGGLTINSFLELFLNSYYVNKVIGFSITELLKIISKSLLISILCLIPTYIISNILCLNWHSFICVSLGIISYVLLYLGISWIINRENLLNLFSIVLNKKLSK